MIGKKILWFVASTFVSFIVFASIAQAIQPLVNKLTDQRLTACEGQSVISTSTHRYAGATSHSLDTIEHEQQLWQAQGITHYCVEVQMSHLQTGTVKFVLVVQNGEINRTMSDCFVPRGHRGFDGQCHRMFEAYDYGLDYLTIDALFENLQRDANDIRDGISVSALFDPTYHVPLFLGYEDSTSFHGGWETEIVAFVPLD
jgi:hypothetical protein